MKMEDFRLDGKVALITGGTYGIGYAIAKGLAAAGATITFCDIKAELVEKGLASYKADGIKAYGYVCNVCDEAAVQDMVKKIEAEVGVIDILVNNAGIIKRIPMIEMSAAEFRQVIDVDLNAPFIVAKAVLPSMIKKGHGKIINICSMMSELGRETVSAYAAAKGGVIALTKELAHELAKDHINVNSVAPGLVDTRMARIRPWEDEIADTLWYRVGQPEDIAYAVAYLASAAGEYCTGQVISPNGGAWMQ